jgi:glucose dehydrogenase
MRIGTLDKKIRAFNSLNGQELWSFNLPYAGFTPPTIYQVDSKQYILVVSSGGGIMFNSDPERAAHGDAFLSFRLPD